MKREVALFKDRRGGTTAKNLIATFKMLGMSDAEIKAEMLKWQKSEERPKQRHNPHGGD